MRHASRVDENQALIVQALRRAGARVQWFSYRPRRAFSGQVQSVGKKTAHVRRSDGKMKYVKLVRLR